MPVAGLADRVGAVAAGGQHSCVVTAGGAVQCWGSNHRGTGNAAVTGRGRDAQWLQPLLPAAEREPGAGARALPAAERQPTREDLHAARHRAHQHLGQPGGFPRHRPGPGEHRCLGRPRLDGSQIIVERAMYLDRPGQPSAAGHDSAGVTAAASEWFLAEGATGAFFALFVLVANPGPVAAQVQASFRRPDGTTVLVVLLLGDVAPGARPERRSRAVACRQPGSR